MQTSSKNLPKLFLIGLPLVGLSACGGSDTEDRLDVADPVVRFVNLSSLTPNLTFYRNEVGQALATNTSYKFASDYFFVDSNSAQFAVKTTQANVSAGSITLDVKRGNRYSIIAFPSSINETSLYEIRDPYNKSVTSNQAKLRIVNGSFNASSIDLYVNDVGTNITTAGVVPIIAGTAYKTAGPGSGSDSLDLDGGNYQITITAGGTKNILFKSVISIEKNKDLLLLTIPDSLAPNAIKTLIKIDGVAGATELVKN